MLDPRSRRPAIAASRHARKLLEAARLAFEDELEDRRREIRRIHIFSNPQPSRPPRELVDAEILEAFEASIAELATELDGALEEAERRRIDVRGADSVIAVLLARAGGEARIPKHEMEDAIPGSTLIAEPYADGLAFRLEASDASRRLAPDRVETRAEAEAAIDDLEASGEWAGADLRVEYDGPGIE